MRYWDPILDLTGVLLVFGLNPQDVVEIVAAKALWNHSEPQLSIMCPQHIQSKVVIFTQFQQVSTSRRIWFGTRFSTLNFSLKISKLQRWACGIWGSVGILEVQFRLQPEISRLCSARNLLNLCI